MTKAFITEIPLWKRNSDSRWFLVVDKTTEGAGLNLFHMISSSEYGPWDEWFPSRANMDEYLAIIWDISPDSWKEYDGPLKIK